MTRKLLISILGAVALVFSAAVPAQGLSGAYVGLDVGNADFGPVDDTAFKLFAGAKFHPNIGAEFAYSQLLDKSGLEVTGLEVNAVGFFPLAPQLNVIGKLGFARIDVSPGEDENEFTFGIGIQYDVTRQVGARLQWQRYTLDPEDIDLITIGIVFTF